MRKILVIFGTRPEAIKMAPLVLILKKRFDIKVCVTAQHREMLDQVLRIFNIKPDYDLNIMKSNQDLFDVTEQVLLGTKKVIFEFKPDLVMLHGDTITSMAASMAAFFLHKPVAHIEAGLRTNDIHSPFPEEFNRKIVSLSSRFHFAPTEQAKRNLLDEKINGNDIHVCGNTVIDALLSVVSKARLANFPLGLLKKLPFLKVEKTCASKIILVTAHRRENFGKGVKQICEALLEISSLHSNVEIIFPVHLNPNVSEIVNKMLLNINNIHLIEPLDYLYFVKVMDMSYMIITDSGGIQEEAPSLGKPVLVMRESTERPEAIQAGTVKLVGAVKINIVEEVSKLLNNDILYNKMSLAHNPYGDGQASKRIFDVLDGEAKW